MLRRKWVWNLARAAGAAALLGTAVACQSSARTTSQPCASAPAGASDPAAADQADSMASEDAQRFKLKSQSAPRSQRPPEPSRRTGVDQPRIRP
ncbi:MAG: hypothetical protein HRF50_14305 [Phycisphaerae bacterium]|jgi:hypothetical protein